MKYKPKMHQCYDDLIKLVVKTFLKYKITNSEAVTCVGLLFSDICRSAQTSSEEFDHFLKELNNFYKTRVK